MHRHGVGLLVDYLFCGSVVEHWSSNPEDEGSIPSWKAFELHVSQLVPVWVYNILSTYCRTYSILKQLDNLPLLYIVYERYQLSSCACWLCAC